MKPTGGLFHSSAMMPRMRLPRDPAMDSGSDLGAAEQARLEEQAAAAAAAASPKQEKKSAGTWNVQVRFLCAAGR